MTNVKTPCPDCPFSRGVKPGALGGSSIPTYLGQAHGPFMLPCHKHCDFDDPDWKAKARYTPQCAGAAMFRANVGVAGMMPEAIHALPSNPDQVFASAAEFLAHHSQVPVPLAQQILRVNPVIAMLQEELRNQAVMNFTTT